MKNEQEKKDRLNRILAEHEGLKFAEIRHNAQWFVDQEGTHWTVSYCEEGDEGNCLRIVRGMGELKYKYWDELKKIVYPMPHQEVFEATALQMAEAIAMAIGKWEVNDD